MTCQNLPFERERERERERKKEAYWRAGKGYLSVFSLVLADDERGREREREGELMEGGGGGEGGGGVRLRHHQAGPHRALNFCNRQ